MSVIDPSDIETGIGRPLTATELAQAEQWIRDAEMLIKARLGDLDDLDQEALAYVVREAVLDRFRNPDGVSEQTESIDDYSRTWKLAGTKRVTIWPEWWSLLDPGFGSGAFSVRPSFEPDLPPVDSWA